MFDNRIFIVIALLLCLLVVGGFLIYLAISDISVTDDPIDTAETAETIVNDTNPVIPDVSTDKTETPPPSTANTDTNGDENQELYIGDDNIDLDISDNETPVKNPYPSASADEIIYGTKGDE